MLIGTVTLWALNFTVSKYILDKGFHPLAYASIRYGAAALIFFAITIAIEGTLRLARKDADLIAELGLDLRVVEAARSWLAETEDEDRDYSAVLERITRR